MPTKTTTAAPATTRRALRPSTPRREPPWATEPPTPQELRNLADSAEDFARGDYCTLDDLEADLKHDVARLRSHKAAKRPAAKVPR